MTPELVLAVLRDRQTGEGFDEMTNRDMIVLARKAISRSMAVQPPRSVTEIPAAMKAARDAFWRQWTARAELAAEGREQKFKRLKDDVRAKYAPATRAKPRKAPKRRGIAAFRVG